jgi:Tfp pilus assembly protein FimT
MNRHRERSGSGRRTRSEEWNGVPRVSMSNRSHRTDPTVASPRVRRPIATGPRRGHGGHTLIELLITVTLLGIVAIMGVPAFHKMMVRSRLDGMARQTSVLMSRVRSEAIKRNRPGVLLPDTTQGTVSAFLDSDDDQVFGAGDLAIATLQLPRNVSFVAPGSQPIVDGFTSGVAVFERNGSTRNTGALRFGDPLGNFLEVRVSPAKTGRVRVRKFNPDLAPGPDGTQWFTPGQGGEPWKWY